MLRDYQSESLTEIRKKFAAGIKRVLLWLETGSGKTVVFCEVLKGAHAKGRHAIMVVRGKDLVDQASQRLFRENVPHGCLQADHWNKQPHAFIQICSIDTLFRRKLLPKADLIVIDEADLATSDSFMWLLDKYKDQFVLSVTATPYAKKGLRHIADAVVHPISYVQLVAKNYLKPLRYYVPSTIDLTGVGIDKKTGDFKLNELDKQMRKAALYADIVDSYKKIAYPRPAILFASSIAHSLEMVEKLKESGITAEHVEADTPQAERQAVIKRVQSGETNVVCNVGVFCRGVDIPCISAVIMARPTMSYNLYQQQLGRGTRIHPSYPDCIVLDHANNIKMHGFKEHERAAELDPPPEKMKKFRVVMCKKCFHAFDYNVLQSYICPLCGYDNTPPPTERPRSAPQHIDDHLKEVKATDITPLQHIPQNVNKAQYKRLVDRWINEMLEKKYKIGWLLHRMEWKNGTLTEEQKKELINAVTKLEAHRTSGGNGSNA